MTGEGASKTAEGVENVNSDTELTDPAAVLVEERAKQTDRDAARLGSTSLLVQIASTLSNCSSSE